MESVERLAHLVLRGSPVCLAVQEPLEYPDTPGCLLIRVLQDSVEHPDSQRQAVIPVEAGHLEHLAILGPLDQDSVEHLVGLVIPAFVDYKAIADYPAQAAIPAGAGRKVRVVHRVWGFLAGVGNKVLQELLGPLVQQVQVGLVLAVHQDHRVSADFQAWQDRDH